MDRGAWHAIVHMVTKSWTQLSMRACTLSCPGSLQKLFSLPEKLSLAELFVIFKTQFLNLRLPPPRSTFSMLPEYPVGTYLAYHA